MIKRIVTFSLTAIACLTMQAQTNNDVVTLAKSSGYWVPKPSVAIGRERPYHQCGRVVFRSRHHSFKGGSLHTHALEVD